MNDETESKYPAFFGDQELQRSLAKIVQKIKAKLHSGPDVVRLSVVEEFILEAVTSMRNSSDIYDESCRLNIDEIGGEFRLAVDKFDLDKPDDLELLASMAYRFVLEVQVVRVSSLSYELNNMASLMRKADLKSSAALNMEYAQFSMVIAVLKRYLHHEELVSIKKLPLLLDRAEKMQRDSEIKLEARVKQVATLEKGLIKLKIGADFVGLAKGFSSLRWRKSVEKHFNFICLLMLACVLISPAAVKVYFFYIEKHLPEIDVYTAVSIAGLELVFIFFFRVALHNFRAVKAQILQLDLRVSILQFVQSYTEFVREQKAKGDVSLDRFEQLIFSGLVSGESDLPSTFDGIEGVAKIVEKLRAK